jgi:hypothetical protein
MQLPVQLPERTDCLLWKSVNVWSKKTSVGQQRGAGDGANRVPQRGSGSAPSLGEKGSERKCGGNKRSERLTLSHQVPPRRIQRVIHAPSNIRAVRRTRAVLVDIRRTKLGLSVQPGVRAYIAPPPASRMVIPVHPALELAYYSRVRIEDVECLLGK